MNESQIGFIEFVVKPSFAVLGEILPEAKHVVVPIVQSNKEYYVKQKEINKDSSLFSCRPLRQSTTKGGSFLESVRLGSFDAYSDIHELAVRIKEDCGLEFTVPDKKWLVVPRRNWHREV